MSWEYFALFCCLRMRCRSYSPCRLYHFSDTRVVRVVLTIKERRLQCVRNFFPGGK